jgi:hypothetical protein
MFMTFPNKHCDFTASYVCVVLVVSSVASSCVITEATKWSMRASQDPYLVGEYAINFVKGFQEAPEDPTHLMASACCKHYVANEMENTNQNGIIHKYGVPSQPSVNALIYHPYE